MRHGEELEGPHRPEVIYLIAPPFSELLEARREYVDSCLATSSAFSCPLAFPELVLTNRLRLLLHY